MLRIVFMLLVGLTSAVIVSSGEAFGQPGNMPMQIHGNSSGKAEKMTLLDILKRQKLVNYPSATIGEAFDKYRFFTKGTWQESHSAYGKTYFDFTGMLKKGFMDTLLLLGDTAMYAVEIKFAISPSGDYGVVMASRIDYKRDGRVEKTPIPDLKGLLDKLYANERMNFN